MKSTMAEIPTPPGCRPALQKREMSVEGSYVSLFRRRQHKQRADEHLRGRGGAAVTASPARKGEGPRDRGGEDRVRRRRRMARCGAAAAAARRACGGVCAWSVFFSWLGGSGYRPALQKGAAVKELASNT